jgi:hypothetical protein
VQYCSVRFGVRELQRRHRRRLREEHQYGQEQLWRLRQKLQEHGDLRPDGCRDLANDNANCGVCGNVCPSDQKCVGGFCQQCFLQ